MKFGRLYTMEVQGREKTHQIAFPLTCKFRVMQSSLFTLGEGVFLLFNLNQDVRNDLYKDVFESAVYKRVTFAAGYQIDSTRAQGGVQLPLIFQGNVLSAESYRQGPDWITEIHATDGGFAVDNGSVNLTKPAGYEIEDVLRDAIAAMPNVTLGVIGSFPTTSARGITFCGNPFDLIARTAAGQNAQAFIAKERVHVLRKAEYLEDAGGIDVISAETGMVGTPRVQEAIVKARLIFEPRIEIAQLIRIDSQAIPSLKTQGDYKVLRTIHMGTISGAIAEDLITEVEMYRPGILEAVA